MVSAAGTSKKPNEIQNKTRRKTEYFIKEFACNADSFFLFHITYVNIDITERRNKKYDSYHNRK